MEYRRVGICLLKVCRTLFIGFAIALPLINIVLLIANFYETNDMEDLCSRDLNQLSSDNRRKLNQKHSKKGALESRLDIYNLSSGVPLDVELFDCLRTNTTSSFMICVYDMDRDIYISNHLRHGGIWEPFLTKLFTEALDKYPNTIVMDVGANIGYYSFLTCVKGHKVIAVEPVYTNIVRFHKAALLNRCQHKIKLVSNALYDKYELVTMTSSTINQGGVWINSLPISQHLQASLTSKRRYITTTTLDDLIPLVSSGQVIIKIDIEGFECRVFNKGLHFLHVIHVPYIFMEWRKMFINRDNPMAACSRQAIKQLTMTLAEKGYTPVELHTGFRLDPNRSSTAWKIGDVYWQHYTAPDLQPPY